MPYAPGPPNEDTKSQAQFYSPAGELGMGPAAGAITAATFSKLAAEWFQALKSMGGATIRERLASLPTLQNIVEMSGGMNVGGPAVSGVKAGMRTGPELEAMPFGDAMRTIDQARDYMGAGGFVAHPSHFMPDVPRDISANVSRRGMQTLEGGSVPPSTIWDRAINAAGGVNDPQVQRMLGLGK